MNSYNEVVNYLESLQIMPKTMPGLQKIKRALTQTSWFTNVDANKVIVVAGTNGKGTTCAALEALLMNAGQRTGFYSSPHLISTNERIRICGDDISQVEFVKLFDKCKSLIQTYELSHFEALTLMAGEYFFGEEWGLNLDWIILEVGLGGIFDATNAFPHKYNVITKLGLDHVNILGNTIEEIAKNKFGIVGRKGIVVHHRLPSEVLSLKMKVQKETNSNWVEADVADSVVKFETNLIGKRAIENIMSAITLFQMLGFNFSDHAGALKDIRWSGRMQKVAFPQMKCPMFVSGDHNLQGIESLIDILKDFKWRTLHLLVGVGVDKDDVKMFSELLKLRDIKLYLTETPFKGRKIEDYDIEIINFSVGRSKNSIELLQLIANEAVEEDVCIVTGSLYLVGDVLKFITST